MLAAVGRGRGSRGESEDSPCAEPQQRRCCRKAAAVLTRIIVGCAGRPRALTCARPWARARQMHRLYKFKRAKTAEQLCGEA